MKLSVVIPVRNDLDNLRKCIDYIMTSDKKPYEIIVVDDASDHELKKYLVDKNVTVVRLNKQGGPARARNIGVKDAEGDIILFIDSDVFVKKDTIDNIFNEFKKGEEAVVGVFDDYRRYKTFFGDYKNLWMKYSYEAISERAALFYTSLAAIKKDIFIKIGGFNENYDKPSTEDTAYGNILWNNGIKPLINPKIKAVHNKEYSLYDVLKTDFYRASDLLKMKLRKDMGELQEGNRTSVPAPFIVSVLATFSALVIFSLTGSLILLALLLMLSIVINFKFLSWIYYKRKWFFVLKSAVFLPLDHLAVLVGMAFGLLSYISGNKY
jgi:glycosyltransferase involved in cell wall biosynthesis